MNTRNYLVICLAALSTVAMGITADNAAAASVEVDAGVLEFLASPGEANNIYIDQPVAPGPIRVREAVPSTVALMAGAGCVPTGSGSAECSTAGLLGYAVSAGNGIDFVHVDLPTYSGTLNGEDGNDYLYPGLGSDVISGGNGTDTVSYERSADLHLSIGDGANDGEVGEGDDIVGDVENLRGNIGNDVLVGDDEPNQLDAGPGDNQLVGGAGADQLFADSGADSLNGGEGADVLVGANGPDALSGGPGYDVLAEYMYRSEDIVVFADGLPNDGAVGESDNVADDFELIEGGEGNDLIVANADIDGGSGNDSLVGFSRSSNLNGQAGDDTLTGGSGDDDLVGGPGTDDLNGGDGSDVLHADSGADVLAGGTGVDVANYFDGGVASLSLSIGDGPNDGELGEGDDIRADVENLVGNAGGDVLVGSDAVNHLDAGPGDDVIRSRDTVVDVIRCGGGTDDASDADMSDFDTFSECELLPAPPPPPNVAPTAIFTAAVTRATNRRTGKARYTIELLSSSRDSDGSVTSFEWLIDGKPISAASAVTLARTAGRPIRIQLRITDDDGAQSTVGTSLRPSDLASVRAEIPLNGGNLSQLRRAAVGARKVQVVGSASSAHQGRTAATKVAHRLLPGLTFHAPVAGEGKRRIPGVIHIDPSTFPRLVIAQGKRAPRGESGLVVRITRPTSVTIAQ